METKSPFPKNGSYRQSSANTKNAGFKTCKANIDRDVNRNVQHIALNIVSINKSKIKL